MRSSSGNCRERAVPRPTARIVSGGKQGVLSSLSGRPGSDHYCDQLTEWADGRYHYLPLDRNEASKKTKTVLTLAPQAGF